jgi:hypothetical protein
MNDFITKLREESAEFLRISQKLHHDIHKKAQSAQTGEIDKALYDAHVRPTDKEIAPLLNNAQVPNNVALTIQLIVDQNYGAKFQVAASPNHPSAQALANLLDSTYSKNISAALRVAHNPEGHPLKIVHPTVVPIATF